MTLYIIFQRLVCSTRFLIFTDHFLILHQIINHLNLDFRYLLFQFFLNLVFHLPVIIISLIWTSFSQALSILLFVFIFTIMQLASKLLQSDFAFYFSKDQENSYQFLLLFLYLLFLSLNPHSLHHLPISLLHLATHHWNKQDNFIFFLIISVLNCNHCILSTGFSGW